MIQFSHQQEKKTTIESEATYVSLSMPICREDHCGLLTELRTEQQSSLLVNKCLYLSHIRVGEPIKYR